MPNRYQTDAYERAANDFYPTPRWVTELLTNTVRLRGVVWEPCGGQGALAQVIAGAGYKVVATDLVEYDNAVFPVASGIDALQASLPAGVRTIATNPPYDKFLLPKLVRHWLGLLQPVGGQLALLLRVLWAESKGGQLLTTKHPAYSGKLKTPRRIQWYQRACENPLRSGRHYGIGHRGRPALPRSPPQRQIAHDILCANGWMLPHIVACLFVTAYSVVAQTKRVM